VSTIEATDTFPTATITSCSDRLPIEVVLLSQLAPGAGTQLVQLSSKRQTAHAKYVDDLDEPSAKLGGTDFNKGDATSFYSFSVGAKGHPFHCHAGHRIFTAMSGSVGTQLRFSTASEAVFTADPSAFFRAMHVVNIPPDCLFVVRFPGMVWHQFVPLQPNTAHPALFAISCHSNELSGIENTELQNKIIENDASIPSLTTLLPDSINALVSHSYLATLQVPTTTLSFNAPANTLQQHFCSRFRAFMGSFKGYFTRFAGRGFLSINKAFKAVKRSTPANSLLQQFYREECEHEDCFSIDIKVCDAPSTNSALLLEHILDAFITQPALGVTAFMMTRNILVKPFGWRTSPLGCPVSSLLSDAPAQLFAKRFAVLQQHCDQQSNTAEVILGADDKHLRFRSSVAVQDQKNGFIRVSLATKVKCNNALGRWYLRLIKYVHLQYIVPTMLQHAVISVTVARPGTMVEAA